MPTVREVGWSHRRTCQHEEALQRPAHPCTEALFGRTLGPRKAATSIRHSAPKQASFTSPEGFDSVTTHPSITTPLADFGLLRSAGPALGPRWAMSGHAIQRTSAPISTHKEEKCLLAKSDNRIQGPKDSSRAEENKHTYDTYADTSVFF